MIVHCKRSIRWQKSSTCCFAAHLSFEDFEDGAMDACMGVCAETRACALERLDRSFFDAPCPVGARVHDIRERTLWCECDQVTFRRRRFELADGTRFFALDEALGLRAGSRVSPGAFSMALDDALSGAYARAAELLCRHTRTQLSRCAVGSILREGVEELKKEDSEVASDLFELGPAADAPVKAKALCVEADGALAGAAARSDGPGKSQGHGRLPRQRDAPWRAKKARRPRGYTTPPSTRSGSGVRGSGRARGCVGCGVATFGPRLGHGLAGPVPGQGDAAAPQDRRRDGRPGFPSGWEAR